MIKDCVARKPVVSDCSLDEPASFFIGVLKPNRRIDVIYNFTDLDFGTSILSFLTWFQVPSTWLRQLLPSRPVDASSGSLKIIDSRNGRHHHLQIFDNSIKAEDLQAINAGPRTGLSDRMRSGLRVLDSGFQNTAVMKFQITCV